MKILIVNDRSIDNAAALIQKSPIRIIPNSCCAETDLILNLTHEPGHYVLGHVKPDNEPLFSDPLEKGQKESATSAD